MNIKYKTQEYHSQTKLTEKTKMTTLKETAEAYEQKLTLNVSELPKVPVSIELLDGKGKDSEGVEFTYKYTEIEGKQYRVPGTVIGQLKAILVKMPNIEFITVMKTGAGMSTRYQVMPYQEIPTPQEKVE